ncbi:MAG: hypothetical protein JSS66_04770 [Armatimonadetes bacterium]|nr:hypothetical protein [Armatimonadota bacterium]
MDVKPETYIQGTPKTRVLNIGGASEQIDLQMPILVGPASVLDGRSLLLEQITNALDPVNATLPLIQNASIAINEAQTAINLSLISDGDPNQPPVFEVFGDVPAGFQGAGNNVPSYLLDPSHAGCPTRVARFYDFRVNLAGFFMYVMDLKLQVQVSTEKHNFLGGTTDCDPGDDVQDFERNWGTQFPFLGVSGVTVSGTGTAAVLLEDLTGDYDFDDYDQDYAWQEGDESLNLSYGQGAGSDITLQLPGQPVCVPSTFCVRIYNPNTSQWESLFYDGSSEVVDLSKSVVKMSSFNVTTGLLTAQFEFFCWVK